MSLEASSLPEPVLQWKLKEYYENHLIQRLSPERSKLAGLLSFSRQTSSWTPHRCDGDRTCSLLFRTALKLRVMRDNLLGDRGELDDPQVSCSPSSPSVTVKNFARIQGWYLKGGCSVDADGYRSKQSSWQFCLARWWPQLRFLLCLLVVPLIAPGLQF